MVRTSHNRSEMLQHLETVDIEQLVCWVPSHAYNAQRFCDFFFAGVKSMYDIEALAARAAKVLADAVLTKIVMLPVLSELSRQTQSKNFINSPYPMTFRLIRRWCDTIIAMDF
jgi:hypothetical protein